MKEKIQLWLKKNFLYRWFTIFASKFRYSYYLKNYDIDGKAIFLESRQGKRINGNIFYILKELSTNELYHEYKIYLCCNEYSKEKFVKVLYKYGFFNVKFVVFGTNDYMKKLATSKYLFNDNAFDPFFVKRTGQVYVNTWHGTPFSLVGKSTQSGAYNIGNIQKNLVSADYVICPNIYTKLKIEQEFWVENIASGKVLLSGYPKSSVLYDEQRRTEIRKEFDLENKKVYAYMPVKRGKNGQVEDKNDLYLLYYLYELDKMLSDDEVLYVKLNASVAKNINFRECTHIKRFPAQYEPYDFLSCTDCLVTDYSNVIFDYASTGKKCILFTFDKDIYFKAHKTYIPFDEFPFCRCTTVQELIKELRSAKEYDDERFVREYCARNTLRATEDILNRVILDRKTQNLEEINFSKNEKKNAVVYIENGGKATADVIQMFFKTADFSEYNYYLSFHINNGKKYKSIIKDLPDGVKYFSVTGVMNLGLLKKILWKLFIKGFLPICLLMKIFEDDLENEIRRIFGGANFDNAIHLNGTGMKMLFGFSKFNCEKTLYISNDANYKNKRYKKILKYVCSKYDKTV